MKDIEPPLATSGWDGNGSVTAGAAPASFAPQPEVARGRRAQSAEVAMELRRLASDECLRSRQPQLDGLATALDDVDEPYA